VSPVRRHSSQPAAGDRSGNADSASKWLQSLVTIPTSGEAASHAFYATARRPARYNPRMEHPATATAADVTRELAGKYDTVAYAAQANAQTHPVRLATIARLLGIPAPAPAAARVLEVGCSDGANLLPMAADLPQATFTGCDISARAIARARAGASALQLRNVTFVERDLAALASEDEPFDYIVAHGVYSWVPRPVRDALLALARARLARNGILFVSYNVYPGCHVREAAWQMLHQHVDGIADPQARLAAARELAGILAEPSVAQTETDGLLRQELARVAAQTDSALFHDDLAIVNEPVWFRDFAAHLAANDLTFLGEAKLSMMTAAGLTPRVQQLVAGMDRLQREQYLDFARLRRFRQSLVCRADAEASGVAPEARTAAMHAAAPLALVSAVQAGRALAQEPATGDVSARALRRLLKRLVDVAPHVVPVAEAAAWLHGIAPEEARAARPVAQLLAEAYYAGTVDLYVEPPRLAAAAGERPVASAIARWQGGPQLTNLRHEPLRIDDPLVLSLIRLMDGTRTRSELADLLAPSLLAQERGAARERVDTYLEHLALHGLVAG